MDATFQTSINSGLKSAAFSLNFQQTNKDSESFRNVVKNNLTISKTRKQGLLALMTYVDDCSDAVFIEDSSLWFQSAVDFLADCGPKNKEFVFKLVTKIINQVVLLPDAMKNMPSSSVNKLLDVLCDSKSVSVSSLKCMDAYMSTFSSQCGNKKNQIRQFIVDCVPNVDKSEISTLEMCFAKLIICGNAGHQSINRQNEWKNQMNSCIANLYYLLSIFELRGKTKDIRPLSSEMKKEAAIFGDISGNAANRCIKSMWQYEFLSGTVREMLTTYLPVSVKINVAEMLNLIADTCSVSCHTLQESTHFDCSVLLSVLPSIQTNALLLLKTLIQLCQSDLAIHSQFINKLLIQMLETTSPKKVDGLTRAVTKLRAVCYDTLRVWFSCCGLITSLNEILTDKLFEELKSEFETYDNIQLKDSKHVAKINVHKNERIVPNKERQRNDLKTLCLKAVNAFLINWSVTLSEHRYGNLSSFIINEILRIYRSGLYSQTNLYDSCREAFLSVLRSLVVNTPRSASPPLSIAVVVFNEALRLETNPNIKLYCSETLSIFHNLINPVMPIRQTEITETLCVSVMNSESAKLNECEEETRIADRSASNDSLLSEVSMEVTTNEFNGDNEVVQNESFSKSEEFDFHSIQNQAQSVNESDGNCDGERSEETSDDVLIIEEKQRREDSVNGDEDDCALVSDKRSFAEISESGAKKLKTNASDVEEVEKYLQDFVDTPASNQ